MVIIVAKCTFSYGYIQFYTAIGHSYHHATGNWPTGRAATWSSLEREACGSVLPTARHRCDISSKEVALSAGAMTRRWAPPTRYTLRHNTASLPNNLKRKKMLLIGFRITCLMRTTVVVPPNFVIFYLSFIFIYSKNFMFIKP